jgi:hypothetical protein
MNGKRRTATRQCLIDGLYGIAIFMPDSELKEQFNRATPSDDQAPFIAQVSQVAEKLTNLAGSAVNPAEYAKQLIARLFPTVLPYEIGTPAAFDLAGHNGRTLTDDVMDVILTLATNTALAMASCRTRAGLATSFPISVPLIRAPSKLTLRPLGLEQNGEGRSEPPPTLTSSGTRAG